MVLIEDRKTPPATSLPIWDNPITDGNITGRRYTVLSVGGAGSDIADAWCDRIRRSGKTVQRIHFADLGWQHSQEIASHISRLAHTQCNGWRFAVAAPEHVVLATAAAARSEGVLLEEIHATATSSDHIAVFCAHCRKTTYSTARPGNIVTCAGCRRSLEVHPHVCRDRGHYLGSACETPEAMAL